ncbi:MAG: SPASM domain-containing protein [Desulfurococcaceae archaeon]
MSSDESTSSCCAYYPQKYDFGNVLNESVKVIYNNDKYVLAGKIAKNPKAGPRLRGENIPCAVCIPLGNFVDV